MLKKIACIYIFLAINLLGSQKDLYNPGDVLRVQVTGFQLHNLRRFAALGEFGWTDYQRLDGSDFKKALSDTLVFILPDGSVGLFWEKKPLFVTELKQDSMRVELSVSF